MPNSHLAVLFTARQLATVKLVAKADLAVGTAVTETGNGRNYGSSSDVDGGEDELARENAALGSSLAEIGAQNGSEEGSAH